MQRGITPEQYRKLVEIQVERCAICAAPPGKRDLHLDHDHSSGVVRGLLCHSCNVGLGFFKDNQVLLEKAIAYLARPPFLAVPAPTGPYLGVTTEKPALELPALINPIPEATPDDDELWDPYPPDPNAEHIPYVTGQLKVQPSFVKWLEKQLNRRDRVGDIAMDAFSRCDLSFDGEFPCVSRCSSYQQVKTHVWKHSPCESAVLSLYAAGQEWLATVGANPSPARPPTAHARRG
jgi:recombination endonuclease VII